MERLYSSNIVNVSIAFFMDYKRRVLVMETNYFLDIEDMEMYYGFEPVYKEGGFVESKKQNQF